MTSPVMNRPSGRSEQRKIAPASHEQQEEPLLEEFARLMGTDVTAVRLAPREARQAPPLRPIAQITKQGSDAGAASTASLKAWDESPLTSSDSHRGEMYSNAPSLAGLAPEEDAIIAPRKSRRATLLLGTVFAIGVVGVIGAWAAVKIAPGVRTAPQIDMAADESSKGAQPSQDTAPSTDRTASILPAGEAGEPNPVGPASSAGHATELQQPDKSPPAAPLAAASPEPSGDPISVSSAPVTRSIMPTDAAPVPVKTADQTVAPADASGSVPDPKQAKAGLASHGGSVVADDNASAAHAKRSSKVAEAAVLPTPSDTPPQPARPHAPPARPSFNSSTNAAPQPLAHKIAARPKSSSKPIDHVPSPKAAAAIGPSPPPLDLATAPGAANTPVLTKASSETPSSTDSLLNFVPNLFEKGVGAVRGFMGDASRGG